MITPGYRKNLATDYTDGIINLMALSLNYIVGP